MDADATYGLPHVIIPNPEAFRAKKAKLLAAGLCQLQVITDFDKTLTPVKFGGHPAASTYGVLERTELLSARYHHRAKELYEKYANIEFAVDIPHDEKTRRTTSLIDMVDWWTLANENLLQETAPFTIIAEGVRKSNTSLRPGVKEMCAFLAAHAVPLMVFSAGLGEMLRHCGVSITDNMHTISNFVSVDDKGRISGFPGRMVHVLNKNEHSAEGTPYFSLIQARKSVVLMGDHMGDLGMSKGVSHDVVLNIGFYNEDKADPARKQLYLDSWDVVLVDDTSVAFVQHLLAEIASSKKQ